MKHQSIDSLSETSVRHSPGPVWQRPHARSTATNHSTAAMRFATTCAALGGTTVLRDLMPDLVAVNFGPLTREICDRLNRRGWTQVQTGDWQGELVLGISFAHDGRVVHSAEALTNALISVVCEVQVANTRIW